MFFKKFLMILSVIGLQSAAMAASEVSDWPIFEKKHLQSLMHHGLIKDGFVYEIRYPQTSELPFLMKKSLKNYRFVPDIKFQHPHVQRWFLRDSLSIHTFNIVRHPAVIDVTDQQWAQLQKNSILNFSDDSDFCLYRRDCSALKRLLEQDFYQCLEAGTIDLERTITLKYRLKFEDEEARTPYAGNVYRLQDEEEVFLGTVVMPFAGALTP